MGWAIGERGEKRNAYRILLRNIKEMVLKV
jgi:hypothetical protein